MENTESTPTPERPKRDFEPWGKVTDPKEYNPKQFRYLVHAINPFATNSMAMVGLSILRDEPGAISKDDGDQTINLFSNPERLAERIALSCSVIDDKHHGTWGSAGLIVEAPLENICITDSSDTGALVMSRKLLEEQAARKHLLTAEQLLAQTYPSSYNEVVTLASKGDKKVHLAGFFYKVAADGTPIEDNFANIMKQHAARLNLPVVAISEPNPYADDKIDRRDNSLSVQLGGKRYNIRGTEEFRFRVLDQKGMSMSFSPDEMESILKFMQQKGFSKSVLNKLRQEYSDADAERQKPKVEFDEAGELTGIEKRVGYGNGEMVLRIGKTGYTSWANVVEERKKFSEMMADPGKPRMIDMRPEPMLSPGEVESIVQEAIQFASDKDRQTIEAWYQTVKDDVLKHWQRNQERSDLFGGKLKYFDSPSGSKSKIDIDIRSLLKGFDKKFNKTKPPSTDKDQTGEEKNSINL